MDSSDAAALVSDVGRTLPREEARPIWEQWARHQYQYSDITTVLELERMISEVYPEGEGMVVFAEALILMPEYQNAI